MRRIEDTAYFAASVLDGSAQITYVCAASGQSPVISLASLITTPRLPVM
ncbi:hypothetical protein GII33_01355 [Gordonia pseudamarae]|nr:hypothetical protein GII33_01355 [Gordonia pseudamarae]